MAQSSTPQSNPVITSTSTAYATQSQKYYALVLLTIVYSFNFIDRQLLSILQEGIKADLGLSDGQLGLLTGFSFALFYVLAGIPIAKWADSGNRRNIISIALFVWSFMTAISGFVQNYFQLLLARIGVGVGEAGCSPPSHSIISDIFPREARAGAIGFYSTGVNIGILFGFLLGGWLNEVFGWRTAFLVVGAPGIILAIVVRFTLKEPIRGLSENKVTAQEAAPSFKQTLKLLLSRSSFVHLAIGSALTAFVSYGFVNWAASFMIRSYGISTTELGAWLALIIGVGGAVGVFGGGVLADKLAKKDPRWYAWLPALAAFIGLPFLVLFCLADDKHMALSSLVIPAMMGNLFLGCVVATTHSLVGLKMRAMSSAIFFLIINIIGLGLGPSSIGLLSDFLAPTYGADSLRYAMLYILPIVSFWSVCHFIYGARSLKEDLENAPE
ncbi:spinster family MFS transporter [Thalassotalea euphylliae]|uniref:MFS transporter n=1 Tax=Thalassotalea euphylliae TaxID=1655234 RepID=A0A3E0UCS6_9GAMM|nr:MFS transporter [Thalassotalea euphylliae]REL33895.1 MFS transporter [Thalassotalea euphylliae]